MAIAYDSWSSTSGSSVTSTTHSHTFSWTNRIAVVYVWTQNSTDILSSVTVAWNNATLISNQVAAWPNPYYMYAHYYIAPPTGSQNIVVTFSSSSTFWIHATSYTWVAQTWQPNVSNTWTNNPSTTLSISATSTLDNCWFIWWFRSYSWSSSITFWTDTIRVNPLPNNFILWDSNWPKTPAGSKTMTMTAWSGANQWIIFALNEASSVKSNFFQFF